MRHFPVLFASAALLAGCGVFDSGASYLALRTNPPGADCALAGTHGFTARATTPASVPIPAGASPVRITCQRPGYRQRVATVALRSKGWVLLDDAVTTVADWGSSGLSLIGLDVGTAAPSEDNYSIDMPAVTPHAVRLRTRGSPTETMVEPSP